MKVGLRLPTFAGPDYTTPPDELVKYVRKAEDLGFDGVFVIDHLLIARPAYRTSWLHPLAVLSYLAGVTQHLRLGTLVLALPLHNPVELAKELATIDVLSNGRLIVGLGGGWSREEYKAIGIPYAQRSDRMEEGLRLMAELWGGGEVICESGRYRLGSEPLYPRPVQQPRPPIWLGGGTQPFDQLYGQQVRDVQRVLQRIARFADGWVPHASATLNTIRSDWARIQEYAVTYGRDPKDIALIYQNFVSLTDGKGSEQVEGFEGFSGMDHEYWKRHYLMGDAEQIAQRILEIRQAIGRLDYVVLNPPSFDSRTLGLLAQRVVPMLKGCL